jgi:lysophospholipase L1-like esterase
MILQRAGILALQILAVASLRIASIGSSFAAGPGLSTGGNYAHLLAQKLRAELEDLSISGSTLLGIGSQIDRIPKRTDLVTITSGGNDLGYIGGLTMDSIEISSPSMGSGSLVSESELTKRFNDTLAKIPNQAPNSTVYLVEYLTILGPDVKPKVNVPFNATRVEYHRNVAATLQKATAKAAEGKDWVERIPMATLSQSHGIGSSEPWVNGKGWAAGDGVAWHPRASGMKAVAEIIHERIREKRKG